MPNWWTTSPPLAKILIPIHAIAWPATPCASSTARIPKPRRFAKMPPAFSTPSAPSQRRGLTRCARVSAIWGWTMPSTRVWCAVWTTTPTPRLKFSRTIWAHRLPFVAVVATMGWWRSWVAPTRPPWGGRWGWSGWCSCCNSCSRRSRWGSMPMWCRGAIAPKPKP